MEMIINLNKDQVLCCEGEDQHDLYYIQSGELLVCLLQGTQITPVDYLRSEEFVGELSFFDLLPRSANLIATQDCVLYQFPVGTSLPYRLPPWPLLFAKNLAKKIRQFNEVIAKHGLKKKSHQSITPLTLEEQRRYFQILQDYKQQKEISKKNI